VPASSLIFLVIIALWAAYLVPSAIRRHRRVASARQADRDSEAMRVVVRRGSAPVGQALAAAAANAVGSSSRPMLGPGATPVAAQQVSSAPAQAAAPRATSRVVRRRRQLLGATVAVTVLAWVLTFVASTPWWSAAVPTAALMLVVAALTRHGATAPARVAPASVETTVVLPALRHAPRTAAVPAQRDDRPSPLAGDLGWQPVPVPLPTYLLKDKARTWEPVQTVVAGREASEAEEPTQVLDLREHVRAVNE
jgi:hypothetical protein